LSKRYPGQVLVVAGYLTNSQAVREIGEQIAHDWGSLDTVIINAGTCEYVDPQQMDASIVEHVLRTNLLASHYCIQAAVPLLRTGIAPHLAGIASSATDLPLPRAEVAGRSAPGLRHLFESMRIDLAPDGIEISVVRPAPLDPRHTVPEQRPLPLRWPAGRAARHIFAELQHRPVEIAFPALFMSELWPLPTSPARTRLAIGKRIVRSHPPIKDAP
jgi:NAD(P)-dependent dehydrogenase (short-subunit alcohol dehydrogenase family)